MTVLEIVLMRTKQYPEITESESQLAIDEVEQVIKNICNLAEVPQELKFVWANMAVDLVTYEYVNTRSKDTDVMDDIEVGDITSLKVGDTNIGLGTGSTNNSVTKVKNSHVSRLDDIVMNYREQLYRFRRMVW